jgi:hypothetical protein
VIALLDILLLLTLWYATAPVITALGRDQTWFSFQLSDLFSLTTLIALIVSAGLSILVRQEYRGGVVATGSVVGLVVWTLCIVALSRACVGNWLKRVVFVLATFPAMLLTIAGWWVITGVIIEELSYPDGSARDYFAVLVIAEVAVIVLWRSANTWIAAVDSSSTFPKPAKLEVLLRRDADTV